MRQWHDNQPSHGRRIFQERVDLFYRLMKPDEVAPMCIHFANGGVGKCAFNEATKDAAPPAKNSTTSKTTAIPTTTPKSSIDLASTFLLVSTMAVVGFAW
ncbi:hypothetical protein AC1031_019580 [Aphanomyces cochlioides]|nr:hypothetical protein AC1031_019580 [Aphanomyces cochlioides]